MRHGFSARLRRAEYEVRLHGGACCRPLITFNQPAPHGATCATCGEKRHVILFETVKGISITQAKAQARARATEVRT